MSTKLKNNWMAEASAGAFNESPAISEVLYEYIKPIPVTESLNRVFRGDYLRKWRRSVPLTSTNPKDTPENLKTNSINKIRIFSSQSTGKSHERFFWVSQVCDTLFLRWHSKRKRSSESIFPLCTVKSIHRADELTYFDNNSLFDGVDLRFIFVINGRVSLQMAAESEREVLLWVSGLYFSARYARSQYTINWITNSPLYQGYLASEKRKITDPDLQFNSPALKKELNGKHVSLPFLSNYEEIRKFDESFFLPTNVSHIVDFMQSNYMIARPENINPIAILVRRLLDYRNKINAGFVQMTAALDPSMKPAQMLQACIDHLEALNVEYAYFNKELVMMYPLLTDEEAQQLFYSIVRQCALRIMLNTTGGKNLEFAQHIAPDDYEAFLKNAQSADMNEVSSNLLSVKDVLRPFTYIADQEPEEKTISCFRKVTKPRIPMRHLTLLGFNWSLTRSFNDICIPQDSEEITNILSLTMLDFWIASSHNTYLTGDQLGGSATAGALAEALLRGCRSIELDCLDGNDEPVLCHAWKNCHLTGYVSLREALVAIKEAAFQNSILPVILSFEMHCSDEYKLKVTDLVKSILGDELFQLEDSDPIDLVATVEIGMLLRKFIVKAKFKSSESSFLGPGESAWQQIIGLRGYDIDDVDEKRLDKIKPNTVYAISETKFLKMSKSGKLLERLAKRCFLRVYPAATRLASTNFCPVNPWNLGVQLVALNYQSYDRSMLINHGRFYNSQGYVPRLIYNNVDPAAALAPEPQVKDKHMNNDLLLRIHVLSGTQLPSTFGFQEKNYASSFNNILYSIDTEACQLDMSSLKSRTSNFHERKKLKSAMDSGLEVEEEDEKSTLFDVIDKSSRAVLDHTEKLCPFVEVTVVGRTETSFKTKPVNFNSFNPVWSDSTPPFDFRITDPNKAVILFHVKHFDTISSETIGQASFPVSRLRPGIRWVQLLDSKFMEIECSGLLVHVQTKSSS